MSERLSRFVGCRMTPEQQRKLILLSQRTAEPGCMSAGLRLAIDMVNVEIGSPATRQPFERGIEVRDA